MCNDVVISRDLSITFFECLAKYDDLSNVVGGWCSRPLCTVLQSDNRDLSKCARKSGEKENFMPFTSGIARRRTVHKEADTQVKALEMDQRIGCDPPQKRIFVSKWCALRPVYSDTTQLNSTQVLRPDDATQLNSTRRRVELCRYKHPFSHVTRLWLVCKQTVSSFGVLFVLKCSFCHSFFFVVDICSLTVYK